MSQGRILEGDATYYRARLGLWTDPARFGQGQAAQARFQLQSAGVHGALPGTINDAPVGVHQAFLRWDGPTHRLDAGRFEMAYGDELIIALNPWNQTGRSFDGARVRLGRRAEGAPWLDLFATRARPDPAAAEPTPRPDGLFEGDDWLLGAYADVGPWLDPATTAELYLLGQLHVADDEAQQRDGGVLLVPGTRLARAFGDTRVRLEATAQVGRDVAHREVAAWQADLEVRQALTDGAWVALGGLYATGDDPATAANEGYAHLYSRVHVFLGLMDVIGPRTNLTSGSLKGGLRIGDDTALPLDAHAFARNEVPDGTGRYAGAELDLQARHAIGGGLYAHGLYGVFLPSDRHYPTGDPLSWASRCADPTVQPAGPWADVGLRCAKTA